jgi:hypothetical protein
MTEQDQGNPTPENETMPNSESTPEPRYTDKDVDKLKGSARKEGRNSGRTEREQEILEATGAGSVDDVLEAYNAWKVIEEESAGEAEKERNTRTKVEKERDTLKEELDSAYAFIAEMKQESALRAGLSEAGVRPERLKVALRIADQDSLEVNDDGEVTGIQEVVKAVQKEAPELFGTHQPLPETPTGQGSSKESPYKPRYAFNTAKR